MQTEHDYYDPALVRDETPGLELVLLSRRVWLAAGLPRLVTEPMISCCRIVEDFACFLASCRPLDGVSIMPALKSRIEPGDGGRDGTLADPFFWGKPPSGRPPSYYI